MLILPTPPFCSFPLFLFVFGRLALLNYFARRQIMLMECDYHRFGGRRKVCASPPYEFPSDSTTLAVIDVSFLMWTENSARERMLALILLSLFLKPCGSVCSAHFPHRERMVLVPIHACLPSAASQLIRCYCFCRLTVLPCYYPTRRTSTSMVWSGARNYVPDT